MINFPNYKPNEKPERSYPIAVINTITQVCKKKAPCAKKMPPPVLGYSKKF